MSPVKGLKTKQDGREDVWILAESQQFLGERIDLVLIGLDLDPWASRQKLHA